MFGIRKERNFDRSSVRKTHQVPFVQTENTQNLTPFRATNPFPCENPSPHGCVWFQNRFGDSLGEDVWEACNAVFDRMPLAAVIDRDIFCVHGGIPRPLEGSTSRIQVRTLKNIGRCVHAKNRATPLFDLCIGSVYLPFSSWGSPARSTI